jgi:hypothetical protein
MPEQRLTRVRGEKDVATNLINAVRLSRFYGILC